MSEHSPFRFAIAVAKSVPVLNLLSVVCLVQEGPLGASLAWAPNITSMGPKRLGIFSAASVKIVPLSLESNEG